MARANRHYIPGYTWHLTHRCHKKEFLLKFAKDRRRWTESIAVGGKRFVEELKTRIGIKARGRLPRKGDGAYELREPQSSYGLSFDPKNDALRPENTYFWGGYSDKAVG